MHLQGAWTAAVRSFSDGFARGSNSMSWQELRAGIGLLLAFALIIGGSLGIGLPLALVIIWLFS
jgi:hypothetical protein